MVHTLLKAMYSKVIQVQNNTDSNNIGYKANLIIRNDINGKKYLYDMVKIERDTPETLTLANSNAAIRPEGISPIERTSNLAST